MQGNTEGPVYITTDLVPADLPRRRYDDRDDEYGGLEVSKDYDWGFKHHGLDIAALVDGKWTGYVSHTVEFKTIKHKSRMQRTIRSRKTPPWLSSYNRTRSHNIMTLGLLSPPLHAVVKNDGNEAAGMEDAGNEADGNGNAADTGSAPLQSIPDVPVHATANRLRVENLVNNMPPNPSNLTAMEHFLQIVVAQELANRGVTDPFLISNMFLLQGLWLIVVF
ncbi:Uu.00g094590.m01.CDS01 [Anthostomella pinea]|uniref:Uu.00g094590.m01.CDS01 n=1 Tax=Anthostomella pinea TaxID=933095 RepID=A0AAI8VI80_9PEZI|nr:Uu.00g094590.m01.CDS01 [Anthostomella pinea]